MAREKLTWTQINDIVDLLENSELTMNEIAERLDISYGTMAQISYGKSHFNHPAVRYWQRVKPKYRTANYRAKGRTGTAYIRALTDQEVDMICELITDPDLSYDEIGKQFGVSRSTISHIANRTGTYADHPAVKEHRKQSPERRIHIGKMRGITAVTEEQEARIVNMVESRQYNHKDIQRIENVSKTVIEQIIKRNDAKSSLKSSLTNRNVKDIRKRVANGEKQNALAREYGVHYSYISRIVNSNRR